MILLVGAADGQGGVAARSLCPGCEGAERPSTAAKPRLRPGRRRARRQDEKAERAAPPESLIPLRSPPEPLALALRPAPPHSQIGLVVPPPRGRTSEASRTQGGERPPAGRAAAEAGRGGGIHSECRCEFVHAPATPARTAPSDRLRFASHRSPGPTTERGWRRSPEICGPWRSAPRPRMGSNRGSDPRR